MMMTQMGSVKGAHPPSTVRKCSRRPVKQNKNAKLNGKRIATKSAFSLTILLLFTTTHTHTQTQTHTHTHTHTHTQPSTGLI